MLAEAHTRTSRATRKTAAAESHASRRLMTRSSWRAPEVVRPCADGVDGDVTSAGRSGQAHLRAQPGHVDLLDQDPGERSGEVVALEHQPADAIRPRDRLVRREVIVRGHDARMAGPVLEPNRID